MFDSHAMFDPQAGLELVRAHHRELAEDYRRIHFNRALVRNEETMSAANDYINTWDEQCPRGTAGQARKMNPAAKRSAASSGRWDFAHGSSDASSARARMIIAATVSASGQSANRDRARDSGFILSNIMFRHPPKHHGDPCLPGQTARL